MLFCLLQSALRPVNFVKCILFFMWPNVHFCVLKSRRNHVIPGHLGFCVDAVHLSVDYSLVEADANVVGFLGTSC